ncbi:MAG: hypothetical protein JW888_18705, partial [Pirellulales bacterium]|nr:hypothetical protein [Pirellulales bacterium]
MSHPTTLGLADAVPDDPLPAGLARTLAVAILVLIGLVGSILLWRRLVGALGQPLPTVTLAALGVLLAGTALAVRWLWGRD